jgi:tetratricopeptide (TPR) repeat protein
MTGSVLRLPAGALSALLLLLGASHAQAQTTSTQRAAAEALFQQGTAMMEEKRYAEACDKLAGSQELDPALGTMLYLADCYEQAGRTASAWALFREAAESSKHAGQADREQIATERAASLEKRLSKLELRVAPGRRVPGLELRLNDVVVPSASWNSPLPVDPGPLRIEARAPGKKPWHTQVTLAEGPATQAVDLAPLENAPAAPPAPLPPPAAAAPAPSSSQRIVGYVIGAAGVVALGAGGFFGYRAYSLDKKSKRECRDEDPNACTASGVDLREDAKSAAMLSTLVTIGGGALVVGGLTVVVTAPSAPSSSDAPRRSSRANLPNFGLVYRGVW